MAKWLQVNLDTTAAERRGWIRGVNVELLVSPYDIPEAVRGWFDETRKLFVIDFKYMADEPRETKRHDRYTTLVVGKNSCRLYGMELDVKALQAERIELKIELKIAVVNEVNEALEGLVRQPLAPSRLDNYILAKNAVSITQTELFSPLLHCAPINSVNVHI
jgi:hypothetical protein